MFDNGEEFKVNSKYCSKCNKEVTVENIRKGNIVTWIYKFSYCGLTETDIMDFDKENVELKEKKRLESELLVKYRDEFCLSEKEGEEYVRFAREWVAIKSELESSQLKQSDPDYQKAITLKKLTIVELERFLNGILNKEKYIKLEFDKPVIDKHVIIPLTVMDEDTSRKEYDSIHKLQRVLKKNLECTNWRLMSEGVNYRLGCLSCKLKGYENEDDLIKIVKMKKS